MKILIAVLAFSFSVQAAPDFSSAQRAEYIKKAVLVFKNVSSTGIENIDKFLGMLEKNSCRSNFEGLALSCLREQVEKSCSSSGHINKKCAILSDIVLVNKVNEKQFVSKEEKFRLSKQTESFQSAYAKLIARKQAMLVTEMLLNSKSCNEDDVDCLSKEVDSYCLKHADEKNLPWQACVGAIVWFIGTTK